MQSSTMMFFFARNSPLISTDCAHNADISRVLSHWIGLHFHASRRAYFVRRDESRSPASSTTKIVDGKRAGAVSARPSHALPICIILHHAAHILGAAHASHAHVFGVTEKAIFSYC
jgi:hypothetical protein